MCFSATASFVTAGGLGVVGIATLAHAPSARARLFASFPLIFASQQILEGLLWLDFTHMGYPALNQLWAGLFVFYAQALWPLLSPLALLLIEPEPQRKKGMLFLLGIACVMVGYFIYNMALFPYEARVYNHAIFYANAIDYPPVLIFIYLVVVCGPLLMSSHAAARLMGALVLAGLGVSLYFYREVFVSTWCFFAASLSSIIYLHFAKAPVFFKNTTSPS